MQCPSCKDTELHPSYIDTLFRAHTCKRCAGNFILIEDYVAWRERHPDYDYSTAAAIETEESRSALLCPVTGTVMQKYRISHDSDHRLDYSPTVGGVWLDRGEWEHLKEKNLAGSLNTIFTSQWQKAIREDSSRITFATIYEERFGKETYAKAKEVRAWLNNHPNRADLRAYLLAADPYSAEQ